MDVLETCKDCASMAHYRPCARSSFSIDEARTFWYCACTSARNLSRSLFRRRYCQATARTKVTIAVPHGRNSPCGACRGGGNPHGQGEGQGQGWGSGRVAELRSVMGWGWIGSACRGWGWGSTCGECNTSVCGWRMDISHGHLA